MFTTKSANPEIEGVFDVDPNEVHDKMSQVHLVDVRRPDEWAGELGHIPNSQLISMESIDSHLEEIPKDKTLVIICRSGRRSAGVSSFLQTQGFTNVYNMAGGMLAWNELGYETVTSDDK